jgi:hypothetical protein
MFDQLLPQRIDNTYRGPKLALWMFGLVVLMKVGMSLVSIFNGYQTASTADAVPLDTFTPAGAQAVVSLFALLGFAQLMLCFLGILALVKYRAMVPLIFLLLLLELLGRRLILLFLPVVRTGTPPGLIMNLVLLALMIAGLGLSLRRRESVAAQGQLA